MRDAGIARQAGKAGGAVAAAPGVLHHRQGRVARLVEILDVAADAALEQAADCALVAVGGAVKVAVEPDKKAVAQAQQAASGRPVVRGMVAFFNRLEQGGAQRRGECQRHKHRQGHGRDDGDRELPVDHAGRTREERHRDKNGRQREANAHQRRRDFFHRLAGGLFGR